jgi:hypothetical protein
MIGGFALIAWPAEYGNSGVMTFVANHAGMVYQKDLGDYTMKLVQRMNWFDPDQTRRRRTSVREDICLPLLPIRIKKFRIPCSCQKNPCYPKYFPCYFA